MIELLKEQRSSASLLYFSDHGESRIEGTGHDSEVFSRSHVEIPFLFWLSDQFKASHRDLITGLVQNSHKQVIADILEHTLLDLVGIDVGYLDKTKSLFQPSFVERDRKTLNGMIDYAELDDPTLNAKREHVTDRRAATNAPFEDMGAPGELSRQAQRRGWDFSRRKSISFSMM